MEKQDMKTTRRTFLKFCGALSSVGFGSVSMSARATVPKSLVASKIQKTFLADSDLRGGTAWAFNNTIPGPELRFMKNEILSIDFLNDLEEGSSIHWHGIRNLFTMDGVSGLTQSAVATGDTFHYEFPLPDAGTYWYHSHTKAWSQVARGLYGPLIVEDPQDPPVDHDLALMIDDWRITEDGTIDEASLGSLHDWTHGGRLGNWLTVNGDSQPVIEVFEKARIRLRLINAANARVFGLSASAPALLIAEDGFPRPHEEVTQVVIAPGQRADLIVDIGKEPLTLVETRNGAPLTAVTINPSIAHDKLVPKDSITQATFEQPPGQVDLKIPIRMQGGAMGNLAQAEYKGTRYSLRDLVLNHKKVWAFNGKIPSLHEPLARVERGQVVEIEVWNDTRWTHGMHLHGHHFWVKQASGAFSDGKRDTYLFERGERSSLIFVADNPGRWLFHCHTLEHHAAGMGATIDIV